MDYDYDNELNENELFSGRQGPLSPETGDPMMDITESFGEVPAGVEVWECLESRSIYIRTNVYGDYGTVDFNAEELNEIGEIARQIIS
tara:strand:+ start:1225 stop:1488 length:264 start_codon:yes stop_codon:yes gene_type:complete